MAELRTRILLRNDTAANWLEKKPVLAKGEFGIEIDTRKIKIGDGTTAWDLLPYATVRPEDITSENIYTIDIDKGENHLEAIAEALGSETPNKGDMAIVREAILGDPSSEEPNLRAYTSYVYDGSVWQAMDGNYDAENVYFANDLIYTKAIGELPAVPSTGSATLAARGKNVKSVLSTILAKRNQPSVSDPAVSLSGMTNGQDLEIGTSVEVDSQTFNYSLSAGSYTYGPATGVTAQSWSSKIEYTAGKSGTIAEGTGASLPYEYSFRMGTDGNTISIKYSATATHNEGAVAKDNLGDDSNPVKKIAAGNKSNNATKTYTCFRKMFYGTRTNTDDLTSDMIRALTGEKEASKSGNSLSVSIPVGAKRVIIAVPATRSVTSVKDVNDSSAEIFSAFVKSKIGVRGAEDYNAIDYNVYVCDYANPATAANTYKVSIS